MLVKEARIEEIAERYVEITRLIKELEEEKEDLRRKLLSSQKEQIKTKNGTVRVLTKRYAILDEKKIILTLSKQELAEVASVSISKFKKIAETKELNVEDFVISYRETKEVLVNLPKS